MYKAIRILREDFPPDNWEDAELIYLITDEALMWKWAYLKCPCGCKEILGLNLHIKDQPKWNLTLDSKEVVTIHPSVNRTINCKSHFNIENGKLIMH